MSEHDARTSLTITLDEGLRAWAERCAREEEVPLERFVEALLEDERSRRGRETMEAWLRGGSLGPSEDEIAEMRRLVLGDDE